MGFCTKCGRQTGGEFYCTVCGSDTVDRSRGMLSNAQNADSFRATDEPAIEREESAQLSGQFENKGSSSDSNFTPFLVWAVFNLLCCCQPCGIASLILLLIYKDREPELRDKNFNYAKIINIIGTVCGLVVVIFYLSIAGLNLFLK